MRPLLVSSGLSLFLCTASLGFAVPAARADTAAAATTTTTNPNVTVTTVSGHDAPVVTLVNGASSFAAGTVTATLDTLAYANLTATGFRYEQTFGMQSANVAYLTGEDGSPYGTSYGLNYKLRTSDAGTLAVSGGDLRGGAFAGLGFTNHTPGLGYDFHITRTAKDERAALSTSTKLGAIDTNLTLDGTHALVPDALATAAPAFTDPTTPSFTNATASPLFHVNGGLGFAYRMPAGRSLELKFASSLDSGTASDGVTLSLTQRTRNALYVSAFSDTVTRTKDGEIRKVADDLRVSRRIVTGLTANLGFGVADVTTTDPTYPLAGLSANAKAGVLYSKSGFKFATTLDRTETRTIGGAVTPTSGVRYDVTLGPSKKVPFHITASVSQRYGATNQPVSTVEIKLGPNR